MEWDRETSALYAGTALLSFSGGLGGRAYLGEAAILSLQTDVTAGYLGFGTSGPSYWLPMFSATPRISSAVSPDKINGFYGGIQGQFLGIYDEVIDYGAGEEGAMTGQRTLEFEGVIAGFFVGLDRQTPGSPGGMQVELSITPLHFLSLRGAPEFAPYDIPSYAKLSVSFYGRRGL